MPQYRRDPLTGRWVIVAAERAARPHQFDIETSDDDAPREHCPFCPGNESRTPPELDALRSHDSPPDAPGWRVRVVPNQYPAVASDDAFPDQQTFQNRFGDILDVDTPLACLKDPFYEPLPGVGTHEVIIDTPRHVLCLTDLSVEEVADIFRMYKRRLQTLAAEKKYAAAMIFKNVGAAAGASLPHTHSQLLAMPLVAPPIQRELHRAIAFRRETGKCYWCEHLAREIACGDRIIEETETFVSLCPYVSRFPGEVAIFPKHHESHFERLDDAAVSQLAWLARRTIFLLCGATPWIKGRLSYNLVLKSGPFVYRGPLDARDMLDSSAFWLEKIGYAFENVYHFHLSILPSLAKAAGFEWGCGLHINPIPPETAAASLRAELRNIAT